MDQQTAAYAAAQGMNAAKAVPFMSPMNQYGSSILQLTNPQKEIQKMELTFRSQILDKDGNAIQIGPPLMNEEGISSVVGQVQSVVNQITIMSDFDEKDVPLLIDFLGDTLAKDLMMNRIRYEIKIPAARDKIYFSALSGAYITLKRAVKNGERSFWKGSQQDIRQIIESGSQNKGPLSFLGWGRK